MKSEYLGGHPPKAHTGRESEATICPDVEVESSRENTFSTKLENLKGKTLLDEG